MEHTVAKSYGDIRNTLNFPYEKSKMVSIASSIIKTTVVFLAQSRLASKLICCIAFGSASSGCCLLK